MADPLHRLLRLIRTELQVILGDRKTRMMLLMPVLLQTLIFPFAAKFYKTGAFHSLVPAPVLFFHTYLTLQKSPLR